MNQPIAALLAGNALRLLIILVYLAIGVAALIRRAQLGTATVPAVLGSSSLAIANIVGLLGYFWQLTVM